MAHFKTAKAEIAHWRSVLGSLSRTGVKQAELGGDGKDIQFEQAFSNLAHAFLKDKAPSLLQYELGFQLLERNQDSTKAVGIFGFKIGNQLVYAPAFFLNGDLKGHELLYLKDQGQFVPLKENWLNHILNKKPNVLGEQVDKNTSRLGITPPDLGQMSESPAKFGSAIRPDLLPGVAAFAHFATTSPYKAAKYEDMIDLETFLKKEGTVVIDALVRQLMSEPKLAEKFASDFDGMGIIQRAVEAVRRGQDLGGVLGEKRALATWSLGDKPPKKMNAPSKANGGVRSDGQAAWKASDGYIRHPAKSSDYLKEAASASYTIGGDGKLKKKYVPKAHQTAGVVEEVRYPQAVKGANLRIVTMDSFDPKSDLSAGDRELLLRDGVVFLDKRAEEETSVAYGSSTLTLTNPTDSGIYEILVKPGSFVKCLVLFGPHNHDSRQDFATVVRIEGEKNWLNIHPSMLWVKQKGETNGEDYAKWMEGLPAADSLSKSDSAVYVLVGPRGQASCPFRVKDAVSAEGPIKVYDVRFKDYADRERAGNLPPISKKDIDRDRSYGDYSERITLTGKDGGLIRTGGGDLYVPNGFKILTVRPDTDSEDGMGVMCGCFGSSSSETPPIVPGNNLDLQRAIFDKTASLKVAHSGSEVQIAGASMSPIGGLIYLVRDVGLRVEQARQILKEAEVKRVTRYRVKLADAMTTGPGPGAPTIPDPSMSNDASVIGAQAQTPMERQLPVDMPVGDASQYAAMPPPAPDQQTTQAVSQAAQTGQKEILDTSAIGSILKAVRDDTMIDRHLGDLMKGLDRLGRILFSFYWHGEEFQDRYGKQDMPELEDSLRNAFEMMGDVVLFLKQKTIEPFPEEMAHADLGDAAA